MAKLLKKSVALFTVLAVLLATVPMGAFAAQNGLAGDIRWDFIADSEGFTAGGTTGVIDGVSDGIISLSSTGADPNITKTGLAINPSEHRYLRFRMKNKCESSAVQIFLHDGSGWFGGSNFTVKKASENSGFVTYEVDLTGYRTTTGKAYTDASVWNKFRFDFLVSAGSVEIDWIAFSKYSLSDIASRTSLIGGISVGDCALSGFDTKTDYYDMAVYKDVYEKITSAASQVSVSNAADGATFSVKVTSTATAKVLDVLVTNADNTESENYRLVCTPVRRPAAYTDIVIDSVECKNKTVTFSGHLSAGDKRTVTYIIHPVGTTLTSSDILSIGLIESDNSGKFSKTVGLYDSETALVSYYLELVLDTDGAAQPATDSTAFYVNNKKIAASVDLLKQSSEGVFEYADKPENKPIYSGLGMWLDIYEANDSLQSDINAFAQKDKSKLTLENISEATNAALLAVLIKSAKVSDMDKYLCDYDKNIKSLVIKSSAYPDKSFSDFESERREAIIENVKANNAEFDGYEDFIKEVLKSMFLEYVKDVTYINLKTVLLENTEILGDQLTELSGCTDDEAVLKAMGSVVTEAVNNGFATMSALVQYVKDSLPSNGGGGGGGGTAGGIVKPSGSGDTTGEYFIPDNGATVTPSGKVFSDLSGFEWASDAIESLYKKGVVNGVGNGKFEPKRTVTREEFVKMVCVAFGIEQSASAVDFADVAKDAWYRGYIAAAGEAGLVNGVSGTMFGTGKPITREEIAAICYRALKSKGVALGVSAVGFTDYNEISDFAKEPVKSLYAEKIVTGTDGGKFAPKAYATRAEAAVIISRCAERLSK